VHDKVNAAQVGRLNAPVDRFNTLPQWYIVTQRMTRETAAASGP
jgi:hypothetical protein